MTTDEVRESYRARAGEYIDLLGSIDDTSPVDRALVADWAGAADGPILDVGCGPGHWTAFLHTAGAEVVGIDPVEAFVEHAARSYPDVDYRLGRVDDLGVDEESVGAILAWYSLIHLPPADLDAALLECARVLVPGGSLLVGFFEGPDLAPFDHAVTTAWFWPIPELTRRIEGAGFTVAGTWSRHDDGARPHGAIRATRAG
ncbi:class I SAM-dependent methyltransferase [Gordonia caeni]|uniref:Class I SAM-dependent methyltransferase n=1 Tax=Gordonia caeni TaxID=1007097 RepID=A0ABP7PLR6_9ACTN